MATEAARRRDAFGVLLVDGYAIHVAMLAIESLRLANKHLGARIYEWRILTADGAPAVASNGMSITPECGVDAVAGLGTLAIISGYVPEAAYAPRLIAWIRATAARGTRIGGIDTGAFLMARAGLLGAEPVTVHWESVSTFREAFPEAEVSEQVYTLSARRFTCAGGGATVDLMCNLIGLDHGPAIGRLVAQDFIHEHVRMQSADQRSAADHHWQARNPRLARVLALMERHIEDPLDLVTLRRRAGLSRRRLDHLFRSHLGVSPMRHYLDMRLAQARQLVLYSELPIRAVAAATGFASLAGFSRSYKTRFGHPPRRHRAIFDAAGLGPVLPPGAPPLLMQAPTDRTRSP